MPKGLCDVIKVDHPRALLKSNAKTSQRRPRHRFQILGRYERNPKPELKLACFAFSTTTFIILSILRWSVLVSPWSKMQALLWEQSRLQEKLNVRQTRRTWVRILSAWELSSRREIHVTRNDYGNPIALRRRMRAKRTYGEEMVDCEIRTIKTV